MSILAGVFSRSKRNQLNDSTCEALKHIISRDPHDDVIEFRDECVYLAKVDVNAYGEPAFRIDPNGSISMLAGEPLLNIGDDDQFRTRTQDLELLHQQWDQDRWDLVKKVRGVFCAVHYDPHTTTLTLIADKLGLRSMYYWESRDYIIFASALRILGTLADVPKEIDLRGLTESASVWIPLGSHTPYRRIALLKAAEIVRVSGQDIARSHYWRWDEIQPWIGSEPGLLQEAHKRFVSAVRRRLRNDTSALAFLSGGLDSRCITAILRSLNVTAHTFTFAPAGTQDRFFASKFAERAGTIHEEMATNYDIGDSMGKIMGEAWRASKFRNTLPPERPCLAWSGDGGSTGLGGVMMSQEIVDLLRSGKQDEAIDVYLRQQGMCLPKRLITSNIYNLLSEIPKQGIRDELDGYRCDDPARAFHLFVMHNDQRRHLAPHLENIDLHKIELHVPFYDSDFLEVILGSPVDVYLRHNFYLKWLKYFPQSVASVPWQSYPGHEPCPFPIEKHLGHQWDKSFYEERERVYDRHALQQARTMLKTHNFPHPIINRRYLRCVTWISQMGLRRYRYVINVASIYYKYWKLCDGNYHLPHA